MASSFRVSRQLLEEAMRSLPVRDALEAKANEVKRRADQIASSEGVELSAVVVSGTRPRGRPFSNVTSRNVSQEWGDSKTERKRILGRAAEAS